MVLNKDQCLTPDVPPFIPGNERLLNEENVDNPETKDTSKYEKDDTSLTSQNYSIEKLKDTKLYTTFIVTFDKEYMKTNKEKRTKLDYSIRSTSSRRNRGSQTSNIPI